VTSLKHRAAESGRSLSSLPERPGPFAIASRRLDYQSRDTRTPDEPPRSRLIPVRRLTRSCKRAAPGTHRQREARAPTFGPSRPAIDTPIWVLGAVVTEVHSMDTIKKTERELEDKSKEAYREGEVQAKEAWRKSDGEEDASDKLANARDELSKRAGNAGDDVRKDLGNAGDDLRKDIDDNRTVEPEPDRM
jgi:hypothetical protein